MDILRICINKGSFIGGHRNKDIFWKKKITRGYPRNFWIRYRMKWLQWVAIISVPLVYLCSQAGWIVAEAGRQPWAIQDLMPVKAAVSALPVSSVQVTFFLFLALFTILLAAEIGIMLKAIKKGPDLGKEE